MNDWFFMLGEPITASERQNAQACLAGLGFSEEVPVEGVPDWQTAHRVITDPAWDSKYWQAELRERQRLQSKAEQTFDARSVRDALSAAVNGSEPAHGAAAVALARLGCTDVGFIRAAAGAASEAAYLAELSRLAKEPANHTFAAKQALFAAGHWPLGVSSGCYYIF